MKRGMGGGGKKRQSGESRQTSCAKGLECSVNARNKSLLAPINKYSTGERRRALSVTGTSFVPHQVFFHILGCAKRRGCEWMHQGVVPFEDLKACRRGTIQTPVSARILVFDLGNGVREEPKVPGRIPSCLRASVFLWMHSNRMENNCRIYGNRSENKFRLEVPIWEHQFDHQRGDTTHAHGSTDLRWERSGSSLGLLTQTWGHCVPICPAHILVLVITTSFLPDCDF